MLTRDMICKYPLKLHKITTLNMVNAKLLWTASCRMVRSSDLNLNHRIIKIQRDNWKSLVNHLINAELTSKLDEAAQVNCPLSNDGEFTT